MRDAWLHIFTRLLSAERHLLVKTLLLLTVIAVGLRALPFRVFYRLIARVTAVSTVDDNADDRSIDRLAWAVKTMSRYVPMVTCLAQAMVLKILLAQLSSLTQLRIGVTRDEKGMFQAPAWLERQDVIIFGESDIDYTPPLDGESQ